ncbi:MAG: DUF2567 domain-containing protein [Micromonosporaceae bacterium]|nr:DUF2567 domain-containing protein [Micromonosporaceae bacterium]
MSHPVDPSLPGLAARPAGGLLLVATVVAALGVPFGLLWAAVAPDVPLVMTARGPAFAVPQPEQLIAADGWFAILAVPFGILVAVGVWLAGHRRRRGVAALAALTVGAVGAGLVGWGLGRRVGLAGYRDTLAAAEVGADLARPPDLVVAEAGWWPPHLLGVVLVPALVAASTYTLLAAWSRFADLQPLDKARPLDRGPRSAAPTGGRLDLTGAEPDRPAGA